MRKNNVSIPSCANGDGAPSPHADRTPERDLLRRSWQPLKYRHATPVRRLLLFCLVLAALFTALRWAKISQRDPQIAPTEMPKSASDLAVFLRYKLPRARIVSTRADGRIDRSFILTIGDSDEATLRKLIRAADRAEEWQGTVLCECLVNWETAELFLEQWGEHAFARPPFVFFGDRELLAQINEALH